MMGKLRVAVAQIKSNIEPGNEGIPTEELKIEVGKRSNVILNIFNESRGDTY